MGESLSVRCPACRRSHVFAAPAFPCPCGNPVAPRLDPDAAAEPLRRRNWREEWVTVRCLACGREDQWPQPELGCACGAVLRVPVTPAPGEPETAEDGGREYGSDPHGPAGHAPPASAGPEPSPAPPGLFAAPEEEAEGEAEGDGNAGEDGNTGATGEIGGAGEIGEACGLVDPWDDGVAGEAGELWEAGGSWDGEETTETGVTWGVPDAEDAVDAVDATDAVDADAAWEAGEPWSLRADREEPAPFPGPQAPGGDPGAPPSDWFGAPPRSFAERYPVHIPLPPTAPRPAAARGAFRPVTIRTARDAVAAAATYLQWLGFREIVQPEDRRSAGVDLRGPGLVAQVDPSTRPAGLRAVECLWLNGLSASAVSVFFSLAGYTPEARSRAAEIGLPLFVLDLTGTPQPVNNAADELTSGGAI
ncbi:hypothetical protein [Streptomyces omiyaensis]|uniref:hypothetical protein n=1 Tax=Streptomyces omiyaensis TaxID=68247 RepID=UPI0036F56AE2